jgi:hypothetical protein
LEKLPTFLYHKLRGKKNHGIGSKGREKRLQKHFPKRRIERLWRAQNDFFIIYYGTPGSFNTCLLNNELILKFSF